MASFRNKLSQQLFLTLDAFSTGTQKSDFQKTGKISADDFVKAGDFLVSNFPSWSWGSGLPEKQRKHLPADKQYLQTRNVPCFPQEDREVEEMIVEGSDDEAWVATSIQGMTDTVDELPEEQTQTTQAPVDPDDLDDDDDIPTLEDEDYSGAAVVDDDDSGAAEETVRQLRTYDITIHYDGHYSTPRVWLRGYAASGEPLQGDEWESDFSVDHANKTVTLEQHPHLPDHWVSIHPCKHAEAMKNMMDTVSDGAALDVKYYMVIFLKFLQVIIPSISYDFTSSFQVVRQMNPEEMQAAAATGAPPAAAN